MFLLFVFFSDSVIVFVFVYVYICVCFCVYLHYGEFSDIRVCLVFLVSRVFFCAARNSNGLRYWCSWLSLNLERVCG